MTPDSIAEWLWYGPSRRAWALLPLEAAFRTAINIRGSLYRKAALRKHRVAVPVVVVGNVTVGGTGKTPVVAWLARRLRDRGLRAGVVLRGYRGAHAGPPQLVDARSDPAIVGDEAVLHALKGADPVVVGRDRVLAAEKAIQEGADVVLCDDGLQHLRLARNCEIAVVDPAVGFGNGYLLPAGPMREPIGRLSTVNAVVEVSRGPVQNARQSRQIYDANVVFRASFRLGDAVNLATRERRPLSSFAAEPVRAVAGVGRPDAFFAALRRIGLDVEEHALPDHADAVELAGALAGAPVALMTEKDAVKCFAAAQPGWWYVELELEFAPYHDERLLAVVLERVTGSLSPGGMRG
jgi:tetraacyldisaccharide 4'-kinase